MKNSQEPAYPTGVSHVYKGLTKREYFAAMAMQGLMTTTPHPNCPDKLQFAKMCIEIADELLIQLSKS